jgi:hypothetical protein
MTAAERLCLEPPITHWQDYLGCDGHITCWTVLERATYQALLSNGVLTAPASLATPDFREAYQWLIECMMQVGMHPPGPDLTPWWCWICREPGHPLPYRDDVQTFVDGVVLQLRLPSRSVLPSCFDLWHWPLNGWYIYEDDADDAAFDAFRAQSAEQTVRDCIAASWHRVFDLSTMLGEAEPADTRSIQGCYWVLRAVDVVDVIEIETLDFIDDDDCAAGA